MRALLVTLLLVAAWAPAGTCAASLPAFGAQADAITVSGVSSGAFMAVQMHVAHSRSVIGVAVIAGGPYYCAQGSFATAYYNCMTPGGLTPLPRLEFLRTLADSLARLGQIDSTANLAQARAWLFSGSQDRTVSPEVVKALGAWYALYGVKPALVTERPAGHAMVTERSGAACGVTAPPFINDCDYDAAGELLRHLLGSLQARAATPSGRLLRFDQDEFADGNAHGISLAAEGFAYVPTSCESSACRIHVAFHGCRQNAEGIGELFVREAGYNAWADSNRLIVLYPQTAVRYFPLFNPRACWDWWGYSGPQYHTRSGAQIRAVKAMVERLGARR